MKLKKVGVVALFAYALITGSAIASEGEGVYEIKANFIESIDDAATIHSRDLNARRDKLLNINQKQKEGQPLSKSESLFLSNLSSRYNKDVNDKSGLLLSTDKVPTAIIIAVAIKESKWGTDKRMKEANNPFAIRCFYLGCGIADEESKLEGVYSELETFKNTVEATRAFAKNININSEYSKFREARKAMRDNGEYLTSLPLAEYITPFSGNKENYGSDLRKIIHENKLYYLDE